MSVSAAEQLGQEIATLAARRDAATRRLPGCLRRFDAAVGWTCK